MTLRARLPLRTTATWGSFRESVVIPLRFGNTGGALLQYGVDRRQWVWAGHPVLSIDTVLVDGLEVGNWVWSNAVDNTGQPIALVTFDAPQDEGITIAARGRGKLSPLTGELLSSPSDVILDLLTFAAHPITAAELSDFKRECLAADLTVAGSVETETTGLAVVREICASIGAIFAPDARAICSLRSASPVGTSRATIRKQNAPSATAALSDIVNDLTIRHAFEGNEPRAAVRLVAAESIRRYGRQAATLDARWLPLSGRTVVAVGERMMSLQARPRWALSAGDLTAVVKVGDVVTVSIDNLPAASTQALGVERDFTTARSSITCELVAGAAPVITIQQLSEQSAATAYAGVSVATLGDSRVITVLREDGTPDAGAIVEVAGVSITADGSGRAYVPAYLMPPGVHTVIIRYTNGTSAQVQVTV